MTRDDVWFWTLNAVLWAVVCAFALCACAKPTAPEPRTTLTFDTPGFYRVRCETWEGDPLPVYPDEPGEPMTYEAVWLILRDNTVAILNYNPESVWCGYERVILPPSPVAKGKKL